MDDWCQQMCQMKDEARPRLDASELLRDLGRLARLALALRVLPLALLSQLSLGVHQLGRHNLLLALLRLLGGLLLAGLAPGAAQQPGK